MFYLIPEEMTPVVMHIKECSIATFIQGLFNIDQCVNGGLIPQLVQHVHFDMWPNKGTKLKLNKSFVCII